MECRRRQDKVRTAVLTTAAEKVLDEVVGEVAKGSAS